MYLLWTRVFFRLTLMLLIYIIFPNFLIPQFLKYFFMFSFLTNCQSLSTFVKLPVIEAPKISDIQTSMLRIGW